MANRTYNIVHTRLINNRVYSSIETCSGLSITEAEKKIVDFAEEAIHCIKDQVFITITKRSVTVEVKDYGKTITTVCTIVDAY